MSHTRIESFSYSTWFKPRCAWLHTSSHLWWRNVKVFAGPHTQYAATDSFENVFQNLTTI